MHEFDHEKSFLKPCKESRAVLLVENLKRQMVMPFSLGQQAEVSVVREALMIYTQKKAKP